LYDKTDMFYVYHGEMIHQLDYQFLISGSSQIYAFLKNENERIAVYVDTNGKVLDVQYSSTPTFTGINPIKPGYIFNGFTPLVETIFEDTIFKAQYTKNNNIPINIIVH